MAAEGQERRRTRKSEGSILGWFQKRRSLEARRGGLVVDVLAHRGRAKERRTGGSM